MTTQNNTLSSILVTGSTGKIGGQVVDRLRQLGVPVIAAARDLEKVRSRHGADIPAVEFDYERPETFEPAFRGVDTLFVVAPALEGFSRVVIEAIEEARRAGVSHIVRYSAAGVSPDGFFPLAVQHGLVDEHLRQQSGWTLIQPTFYQDNIFTFQEQSLRAQDEFYGSSGSGKTSYIASADIAAVVAEVLRAPKAHDGKSHVLTGPEAITDEELARLLSDVTQRTIRFVDVGDEVLKKNLMESGMPGWFAESMVGLENVKRNGWAETVTSTVEEILGRPPQSYRKFIEARKDKLEVALAG